jgi:hypothetical protein
VEPELPHDEIGIIHMSGGRHLYSGSSDRGCDLRHEEMETSTVTAVTIAQRQQPLIEFSDKPTDVI